SQLVTVGVALGALDHERRVTGTFFDRADATAIEGTAAPYRRVPFRPSSAPGLERSVSPHPFLPRDAATLGTRCWEIFEIQTQALATRLASIPPPQKLVLGVSGGLDSTHAALVCAQALDLLGRPRSDLIGVTMPG